MDNTKDGGSVNRPFVLDGKNYIYWKVKMIIFLKIIDITTWKVVVKGWKHLLITSQDGSTSLKPEVDMSNDEALGNDKDLNVIFNGVDKKMIRLINTCTEAKEAWEILKTTHEGTYKVRMLRLQLITTKFKNLRMWEDESISKFNIRLHDMANSSFALGEKMSEEKLVRKILTYLPQKFDMKVTTIEEAQDLRTLKVDKLTDSL